MNARDVLLESILLSIEEEQDSCVEKDLLDNIIDSIHLLKQSIALSKESLRGK